MQTAVTIPKIYLEKIETKLNYLTQIVKELVEKVDDLEPEYGSDAWWTWVTRKGIEDYKKGRYTTIRNKKELGEFLSE